MARWCFTLVFLLVGTAISRSADAQGSAAVSLTHTVMVTVPPRVKVQVDRAAVSPTSLTVAGQSASGFKINVNASQSWSLAISGTGGKSQLEWSDNGGSRFTDLTSTPQLFADGDRSPIPVTATVLVRSIEFENARGGEDSDSETVVLTVVAQ
jgi:hypothetical protein